MLLDQTSKLAGAGGRYIYFAPECFCDCYLPSSDVFSAGIVIYKMLTGVQPWEYDFDNYSLDDAEGIATMISSGIWPLAPALIRCTTPLAEWKCPSPSSRYRTG